MQRLEGLVARGSPTLAATPFGQLHSSMPFQPGDLDKTKAERVKQAQAALKAKAANVQKGAAKSPATAAATGAMSFGGGGAKLAVGTAAGKNASASGPLVSRGSWSKSQVEEDAHRVRAVAVFCAGQVWQGFN